MSIEPDTAHEAHLERERERRQSALVAATAMYATLVGAFIGAAHESGDSDEDWHVPCFELALMGGSGNYASSYSISLPDGEFLWHNEIKLAMEAVGSLQSQYDEAGAKVSLRAHIRRAKGFVIEVQARA